MADWADKLADYISLAIACISTSQGQNDHLAYYLRKAHAKGRVEGIEAAAECCKTLGDSWLKTKVDEHERGMGTGALECEEAIHNLK